MKYCIQRVFLMSVICWISHPTLATTNFQNEDYSINLNEPNSSQIENPVYPIISWNNIIGRLTADHWGVNDGTPGTSSVNTKMANFYNRLKPGVLRLHHKGYVEKWVDVATKTWNREKIKSDLDNAKDTYKHAGRIMLTLDDVPSFISTSLPLTETQENALAAFFGQLPLVLKELGYYIDMYEFLNEKEKYYENDYASYWRMLNKIAIALKTSDPTVKCGGPAVSWPTSAVYKGFIDNCADNMDFISFHLYARGPGIYTDDDLFTGGHAYRNQANNAGAVVNYLNQKNITHLEVFLNEFNVQYSWTPYEPAHHNYLGASWMACFVKSVALKGVSGLNVWNTEDSAYGLNYNSAPANLYLMSKKYLRGSVVSSVDDLNRVEMIPVISNNGSRSVLFINRMGDKTTVVNAKNLLGVNIAAVKGMRLDHTTNIQGREYNTLIMNEVPDNIVLNPYGMVLLTNSAADSVTPPDNLKIAYKSDNKIALNWSSNNVTRRGFQISCNDEVVANLQGIVDTTYTINGLQAGTRYDIKVSTIDEFGNVYPSGESQISVVTRKTPLRINDRTTGTNLNELNFDNNWIPTLSDKTIGFDKVYNGDMTVSKSELSSMTADFTGHTVYIYGLRNNNNFIKVYIDNEFKKEILLNDVLDFDGIIYYDETLSDETHTLKIECDAGFSLDRVDVFSSRFEDVTTNPEKVNSIQAFPASHNISLNWEAPNHIAGIQYYRVISNVVSEINIDTVYSPEFVLKDLKENTNYPITIESYDPCGNYSVSDEFVFTTLTKEYVEIPKLVGSIILDGIPNEEGWMAAGHLPIVNSQDNLPNETDFSGWFKVLWSQRYLYIYIDVTDDIKIPRTDEVSELNEHDGFELYLDGNNDKVGPYTLLDASIKALYAPLQYEELNNVRTMLYAVNETTNGYGIEIRYNLTDLGMVPGTVGKELGLDIQLNDNDKTDSFGLDNKLTWQKNSNQAALNKALLGNMVFVEELTNIGEYVFYNHKLKISPTISDTYVNLENEFNDSFNVSIYSVDGRIMQSINDRKNIDVSKLNSGIYLLIVESKEKTFRGRFIRK